MKELFLRNQLCIPVKGYHRTIIYDLLRRDYFFISNDHHAVLNTDDFIKFEKINDEEERVELINFLLQEEIIFEITDRSQKKRFTALNRNFEPANRITNLIIHADISLSFFDFIEEEYILNLSIIAKKIDSKLIKILERVNMLEIDSIYLYIEDQNSFNLSESLEILRGQHLVFAVNIFNTENRKDKNELHERIHFNFFEEPFATYHSSLTIDKLGINGDHFLEAYNFHSYYRGKIYIDQYGNIKNGLNNTESFGNICSFTKESFSDMISSTNFNELGNINKDNTLVCKDCEFRYMCVDSRVPIKGSREWYHLAECNYNPYLCKWNNEEDYANLTASGVIISSAGCNIDNEKLAQKFNDAWSA